MDSVIEALVSGDYETALIRLWVEATRTVAGSHQASLWQSRPRLSPEDKSALIDWLDTHHHAEPVEEAPPAIAASPLNLLAALDEYLAKNTRSSRRQIPAISVDNTDYALIRRRFPADASAQQQAPNLSHWCKYHRVVPLLVTAGGGSINVSILPLAHIPPKKVSEVTCRLSHFTDEVILCIADSATREEFRATGLDPAEKRWESLQAELQQCRSDAAHLWVVPELSCPLPVQEALAEQINKTPLPHLLLCIPGSFHHTDENALTRNTANLFTGNGEKLPAHHKLTQFSYPAHGINLSEAIVTSRCITLFDSPLGLIGVAICKDFSDASEPLIETTWNLLAPDWLLVPSYGDQAKTLHRHEERAKGHWSLRRTRSLVANQEPLYKTQDGEITKKAQAPGFLCDSNTSPVSPGGSTIKSQLQAPPRLQRVK